MRWWTNHLCLESVLPFFWTVKILFGKKIRYKIFYIKILNRRGFLVDCFRGGIDNVFPQPAIHSELFDIFRLLNTLVVPKKHFFVFEKVVENVFQKPKIFYSMKIIYLNISFLYKYMHTFILTLSTWFLRFLISKLTLKLS